jgi:hypothetical protein
MRFVNAGSSASRVRAFISRDRALILNRQDSIGDQIGRNANF